MRILFTGGGSGGHFYPVIAVATELNRLIQTYKLIDVKLYYMAPEPYNAGLLYENNITFVKSPAGKVRRYFSILNFLDFFKTIWGTFRAVGTMFSVYPDVVFSKGGGSSFPTLFAARLFRIPIIIHESDTVPGRANIWASKFAKKIAVSYPETAKFFKQQEKVAYTGNPIRRAVLETLPQGAHEYLKLEQGIPTITILGGSLGAQLINETVIEILPKLVEKYQVIHQTGKGNFQDIKNITSVVLEKSPNKDRYKPMPYLNDLELRMSAGISSVIVSRAGSTIFEIAEWGIPSVLIPITDSNGDHQRKNAYAYARVGAGIVIEEKNLSGNILLSEIEKIISDPAVAQRMMAGAKTFAKPDAAEKIAKEILGIALEHEI